ncbi:MAG: DNA repair protein RecO [Pseudomonadota bacterium]
MLDLNVAGYYLLKQEKMPDFSTQAVLLRAIDYQDYDRIVTLFTADYGKIVVLAKAAKKSVKRFGGSLELFSHLDVAFTVSKTKKGLPLLKEAFIIQPFEHIRVDVAKTAYASYWCELILKWMEERQHNPFLFKLLLSALFYINTGQIANEIISICFQARMLALCGFAPNLEECGVCRRPLDLFSEERIAFRFDTGGLVCVSCSGGSGNGDRFFSKGALKQLIWTTKAGFDRALRIRFSTNAMGEANSLLEQFSIRYFEKEIKSLGFLKRLRNCG